METTTPTLPPVGIERRGEPYRIEADAVARYAAATNDDAARYLRAGIAPPVSAWVASRSAYMGLLREHIAPEWLAVSVHVSQVMRFGSVLRIGETIESRAVLAEIRGGSVGAVLLVRVESSDDRGPVLEAEHRILLRGVREKQGTGDAPLPGAGARDGHREHLGTSEFAIAEDQSLRFGEVSGDQLPIHTVPELARAQGFPRLVLHGMCTFALCAQAVTTLAGDGDPGRLAEIGMAFTRPVLVGGTVTVSVDRIDDHSVAFATRHQGRAVSRSGYARIRTR